MNAQQQARINTALDQLAQTTDHAAIDAILQAYHASAPRPAGPLLHHSRIIAETRGDRYSRSAVHPVTWSLA